MCRFLLKNLKNYDYFPSILRTANPIAIWYSNLNSVIQIYYILIFTCNLFTDGRLVNLFILKL